MTGTPNQTAGPPQKIRPGRSWYVAAAVLAAATVIAVVALGVPLVRQLVGTFSLKYLPAPGRAQVHLDKAGEYSVYAEVGRTYDAGGATLTMTQAPPALNVAIWLADSGKQLPLGAGDAGVSLQIRNRRFRPVHTFSLDRPGTVVVESAYPGRAGGRSVTLGIGPRRRGGDIVRSVLRIFLIIGIVFLGGGGALAIFILTKVRHVRARRRPTGAAPSGATWRAQ